MKLAIALAAAMISIAPAAAFAQGTGTGDRGDQGSHVGPASENRDNSPYGATLVLRSLAIPMIKLRARITGNNFIGLPYFTLCIYAECSGFGKSISSPAGANSSSAARVGNQLRSAVNATADCLA